ncbi:MAG: hypothetical protein ACOC6A_04795 [Chloroflexota bacterium]
MAAKHIQNVHDEEKQERRERKKVRSGLAALALALAIVVPAAAVSMVSAASSGLFEGPSSPGEVRLDVGGVFWVRLEPGEGGELQWTLKESSDPVVLGAIGHEYEPAGPGNGYVPAEVWSFKATSKGITTVTLERTGPGDRSEVIIGVVVR